MQVAATLRATLKESQDRDARAAQEVAAARARGAQLPALVDRKQHRAESPHEKAEQKQAEASRGPHAPGLVEAAAEVQAEVHAQHLPAILGVAAPVTLDCYRKRRPTSSTVLQCREGVTAAHVSRVDDAAGVDKSGQLSITVAFSVALSFSCCKTPAARAARNWQQEPRECVHDIADWESSCPRFWSLVVVPVCCFFGKDPERNTASKFRSPWSLNHAVAWSGFIR